MARMCAKGDATRIVDSVGDAGWPRAQGRGGVDREEYEERLEGFGQLVSMAWMYSAVVETLIRDDDETEGVLNTYQGFFVPVHAALHNAMLLETAKALDKDSRAASLPNLLNAAEGSSALAPCVDIAAMQEWIANKEELIKKLQTLRNRGLAHLDVPAGLPGGLTYGDFKDLLTELRDHWIALHRAFHGAAAIMDMRAKASRQDTEALRKTLIKVRRETHRRADDHRRAIDQ